MSPFAARTVAAVRVAELTSRVGKVKRYLGTVVEATGPDVAFGELCEIYPPGGLRPVLAEAVGFREGSVLFMPHGELHGVRPGSEVVATGRSSRVAVGPQLLGRIIDAFGNPLDGRPAPVVESYRPLYAEATNPILRNRIDLVFQTRVRAIDTLLTVGVGQRLGIFSGSGVGKSSLLGMIAQNSDADVNVIALIGERGREVREFIEDQLGDGLRKSVVVVATAEQSALTRSHAAFAATAIAEHFRDAGRSVALLVDSLTRFAMARREIGLAIGEPPTSRGYTPSVFGTLPRLLERSGQGEAGQGAITAFYTVLVEGDDFNEPVSDHARSILDGHIVLSREIANRGRFPSIDILKSLSRLLPQLASKEQLKLARDCIASEAVFIESKDLVELGGYKAGANPSVDAALRFHPLLERFIDQPMTDATTRDDALDALRSLMR